MRVSVIICSVCLLVWLTLKHAVISTPMDFQTMLKRVKGRNYKSKREFKDDLDLIWSNCLTYNAVLVRHFNHARRDDRSSFHADLIGSPTASMCKTSSNQG